MCATLPTSTTPAYCPSCWPFWLALLAELSGQLLNRSQVGAQIGMDGKTVEKYIGILEKLFLVRRLPAFSRNTLSRLIKSPKIHFGCRATVHTDPPDT